MKKDVSVKHENEAQQMGQWVFKGAPPWVKSAAVDAHGHGWWLSLETDKLVQQHARWSAAEYIAMQMLPHRFDPAGWQDSPINRASVQPADHSGGATSPLSGTAYIHASGLFKPLLVPDQTDMSGVEDLKAVKQATLAKLVRVSAYTNVLKRLCELSPHDEPIPLEQLETIFADITDVTEEAAETLLMLTEYQ